MKAKTILFLVLILLSVTKTKAGHIMGGDIYYEFVGDSATHHRYVISLALYIDATSPITPSVSSINISSSCFPSTNVSLPLLSSASPVGSFNSCFSSPTAPSINVTFFQDTITLGGTCNDWVFSYTSFIRPTTNGSTFNDDFYIMARLNNNTFQNTSPEFNDPIKVSCTNGAYAEFMSNGTEPDSDSLFYEIVAPRSSASAFTTWSPGFSFNQPINTLPTDSFDIDSETSLLTFTASQAAISVYAVEISEYRYDSLAGSWIRVGTVRRDMGLFIVNCDTSLTNTGNLFTRDASSQSGFSEIITSCNVTSIDIPFKSPVSCTSIDPYGTDFEIFSTALNANLFVVSAQPIICNDGLTNGVTINFFNAMIDTGNYIITTKQGVDSNSVLNACGFEYPFDTIYSRIDSSIYSPVEFYDSLMTIHPPEMNFTCGDSIVRLQINSPYVICSSIAADGSDFTITNSATGSPVSIKSATAINCTSGTTNMVELVLDNPIISQGDYNVDARIGSDGNTLVAGCAKDMMVGERLILNVDTTCGGIGIDEDSKNAIRFYPNPANNYITVEGINGLASITLIDILGNEVKRVNSVSKNVQISLSDLPKGLYFLQVKQANELLKAERIIKY